MKRVEKVAFAGLVLAQAAHSVEEYLTRLWEVFPPARFASGLVSSNLETGFLIINFSIAALGLLSFFAFVLPGRAGAGVILWIWVVIETINGAGHLIWAAARGGYAPGAATAPFLLLFALSLFVMRLRASRP